MMLIRVVGLRILWCCLPLSWLHLMLVSLSPVPALAQPLGQAKVATIFSLKQYSLWNIFLNQKSN